MANDLALQKRPIKFARRLSSKRAINQSSLSLPRALAEVTSLHQGVSDIDVVGIQKMRHLCRTFRADERGVSAIQYALVAAICSISIIVMLYDLRNGVNQHLGDAGQGLQQNAH